MIRTNLKYYREKRFFTQKELAEKSGVSIRMIQSYEIKRRDINKAQAITVYNLANALACNIEDILELDD